LRRREQYLSDILEHAAIALHWIGPDGTILWAKQSELDSLGYTREEYIGHHIREFQADETSISGILDRLNKDETRQSQEILLRRKDGGSKHIRISRNVLLTDVTGDSAIQNALRQSEERYHAFVHNSSEGIWRLELDQPISLCWPVSDQIERAYDWGYLAECNDAMAQMYGYTSSASLIGARLSTLHVRTDPRNEAFLRAFIVSGYQLRDAESHELHRDGSDRYFLNSLVGVVEQGLLVRAWGTQSDITDRKRIENALRESEERFSRFMAHLPGAAWIKNLDGRYIYANPEAERIFDSKLDELRGKTDHDVFPAETAEQFFSNDQQALQHGGLQTIETLAHKDGAHESIVNKFPIRDEDGTPVLVGGIAIDITEQRQAEAALIESQERLDLATTAARIGTFDWDIPTGHLVWNAQEEALFGLAPGTFDRSIEGWAVHVHPDDLPVMRERMQAAMAQRLSEMSFAFRIIRPDQAVRWIEGAARFVYAEHGIPLRMVGVNMDMTERRESEMALRRANADLQQFAYAASHDLQEPLRMITLYTELLTRRYNDALPNDARHILSTIRTGAFRITELVKDLLSYTQTTETEAATAPGVDANVVFREVLATLSPAVANTGARIVTDDLPVFLVQRTHLLQILQNLISNAIKYRRPNEKPVVHISSTRGEHGMTELLVKDNGIGIQAEYHERIFGLFRRLHGQSVPGTGIGLAICRKIVERYNGKIWLESTPGTGSTFHLTLPHV
jgi:PAS domain S-box-containing protein